MCLIPGGHTIIAWVMLHTPGRTDCLAKQVQELAQDLAGTCPHPPEIQKANFPARVCWGTPTLAVVGGWCGDLGKHPGF